MNTNLASYIMGMVIDENDRFYFVQKDGQTYALDKTVSRAFPMRI